MQVMLAPNNFAQFYRVFDWLQVDPFMQAAMAGARHNEHLAEIGRNSQSEPFRQLQHGSYSRKTDLITFRRLGTLQWCSWKPFYINSFVCICV